MQQERLTSWIRVGAWGAEVRKRVRRWGRDWTLPLTLAVLAGATPAWWFRWHLHGLGIDAPLGPDGGLWGTAGLDAAFGSAPVPGLYPWLIGQLGGYPVVHHGLHVNAFAVGLAGAAVGLIGACVATQRSLQLTAVVMGALLSVATGFAWTAAPQVQPDALTSALLVLSSLVGFLAVSRPSSVRMALWGATSILVVAVREHGLVLFPASLGLVAMLPGKGWWRRVFVFLLGAQLVGMCVSRHVSGVIAMAEPTIAKATVPVSDSADLAERRLPNTRGADDMPAELRQTQGRIELSGLLLERAAQVSAPLRPHLLLAVVAVIFLAVRCGPQVAAALALPLVTILPSAFIWTQWRHFLVVGEVGVALALGALVYWLDRLRIRRKALMLGLILGLFLIPGGINAWWRLETLELEVTQDLKAVRDIVAAGAYVHAHAEPETLLSGDLRVAALSGCPLGSIPPWGPTSTLRVPALEWRTWIVTPPRGSPHPLPWKEQARFGDLIVLAPVPPQGIAPACLRGQFRCSLFKPLSLELEAQERCLAPIPGCPKVLPSRALLEP